MQELNQAVIARRVRKQQLTLASDALFNAFGAATLLVSPTGLIDHCGARARERLGGVGGFLQGRRLWHPDEALHTQLMQPLAIVRGEAFNQIALRTGTSIHTVCKQVAMLIYKPECSR